MRIIRIYVRATYSKHEVTYFTTFATTLDLDAPLRRLEATAKARGITVTYERILQSEYMASTHPERLPVLREVVGAPTPAPGG